MTFKRLFKIVVIFLSFSTALSCKIDLNDRIKMLDEYISSFPDVEVFPPNPFCEYIARHEYDRRIVINNVVRKVPFTVTLKLPKNGAVYAEFNGCLVVCINEQGGINTRAELDQEAINFFNRVRR